ncbi:MAG: hypothetical protein KAX15_07385 [Candidatus Omnitrophica bacterium]|nr:hypothetical protein [Candidatus Omnitrophota bacterium]
MKNKKLEEDIKELQEFIDLWVSFKDQFHTAYQNKETTPEDEKKFLETKSFIARKIEGINQRFHNPDDKAMGIISQVVSLDSAAKMSDMQLKKIENDWHISYINFNTIIGSLESHRDELAKVSGRVVFLKKMLLNPFMLIIITILLIVILLKGLQSAGLIDKLKEKLNIQTEESVPTDEDVTDI